MKHQVLKIEGMSCEHCVKAVGNALGAIPGLADIQVDLKGGSASFSFDPEKTPLADITAAITEEGYTVV